ncbi:MAG: pilus assembly protein [Hyphomicrobium sp.]|uniref:TadE/TadG family type IV pilus assembly protein n=1 Tax=Hyphomicrobium sp. TaxID=82 RepID=UPI0025BE09D7|nr:TadE/TadG family type IV pilus assembly protein [Hyphomicrobium sp.]MBX9862751.1 pilus assembly protein [Hyphomicrobium sp.]
MIGEASAPQCLTARFPRYRVALARLKVGLRDFGQDVRGIAAVEFGFIAPIMLVMLLGTVELTRALSIDRRFNLVTTTVADLVTREESLTATDVRAIYEVAAQIMRPYEVSPLKISIIPVAAIRTGTNVVYPVATNRPGYQGGAVPARCQSYALTNGMLAEKESLIVVEGEYTFTPLFAGFLSAFAHLNWANTPWKHKAYARPRKSAYVDFGDKFGTCSA